MCQPMVHRDRSIATKPNPIRMVLQELALLSETQAVGIMEMAGKGGSNGSKMLWHEKDTGPKSLHDVYQQRFRECRSAEQLRETYEMARHALSDAKVRSSHTRIDDDWRPQFLADAAGIHYSVAGKQWSISPSYARKIRQLNGVGKIWGGPLCGGCSQEMRRDPRSSDWSCAGNCSVDLA